MRHEGSELGRDQYPGPGGTASPRGGHRLASQPAYRPLDAMRSGLDRIFSELGLSRDGRGRHLASHAAVDAEPILESAWDPDVAIYKRGDAVVVRADLPGLDKDHLHVDVGPDVVTISGEFEAVPVSGETDHHRSERNHGTFYRTIPLVPGADAEHCEAHFKDGVLEVEFQLPHDLKPKQTHIEIQ
jgi:HSP20 family protein